MTVRWASVRATLDPRVTGPPAMRAAGEPIAASKDRTKEHPYGPSPHGPCPPIHFTRFRSARAGRDHCRADVGGARRRCRSGDRARQRRRHPAERPAAAEEEVGSNMPQMPPEQRKDYLITYLGDVIILAQAAQQQKIDQRPSVQHRIDFERNKVLMETLLQDAGQAAVTDEAMHKVYDEAVKQMPTEQEVRARHILVATEDEAKAIVADLKKGADFATLAKQKSKDPAPPMAAISAISPRTRWCRNSPMRRSSSTGPDLRSGEDAVRLAHHQGRGQAHQADAELRRGQGAARRTMSRIAPRPKW